MAQFNTHGGYFAPKGYFKVNAGGSHEENPNGGVQIGVDPQGVPNMLEEGEPVYNDYVFSDNIYADGGILKKMNIPKQYAGKLYSEIADALIDEAEERPNDPISNNGFNKMLIRLADAQEKQKQMQQQKEVEDELSQMSPEELEMLEQMVAQQGAEEAAPVQEEIAPEMAEEQAVPQMPMMAKGGPLSKLDPFLTKRFPEDPSIAQYMVYKSMDVPGLPEVYPYDFKTRVQAQRAINENNEAIRRRQDQREWENSKVYRWLDNLDNKYLGNTWLHPYYDSPIYDYETGKMKPLANGGVIRSFYPGGFRPSRENQELTESILTELNKKNVNVNPETGMRYELPLQDIHPELDLALAVAQPGTLLEKALAPSMARGVVEGLASGEGAQSLMMASPAGKVKTVFSAEKELKAAGKEISKARAGKNILNESIDAYKSTQSAWKKAESEAQKATDRFNATVDEFDRLKSSLSDMDAVGADLQKTQAEMRLEFLAGKAEKLGEKATAANKNASALKKSLDKKQASFEKVAEKQGVNANKLLEGSGKKTAASGGAGMPKWAKWALPVAGTAGALVGIPAVMNTWGTPNYEMPYIPEEPEVEPADTVASPVVADTTAQKALYGGGLFGNGWDYANGGQMNRFDGGGLADFLKTIGDYTGSLGKSAANGRYAVDRNAKFWNSRTGRQVEASKGYKDWTDYVYNNGAKDPRLLEYFKKLDELINKETGAATLLDENGNLRKDWQSTWRRRRNDGNLGVYHLTPTNFDYTLPSAQASQAAPVAAPASAAAFASIERPLGLAAMPQPHVTNPGLNFSAYGVRTNPWNNKSLYPTLPSSQYSLFPDGLEPELTDYAGMARLGALSGYAGAGASTTSQAPADSGTTPSGTDENYAGNMSALPVFPMYAGGIGSALLALGNVMQEPTKFHLDPMHVNTPYGRIELQDQVYNPIDQNRLENQVIAQGNATARALQNSGLGPSTAAALLASDAATQRARGEGFLQAWDANNQRRNQVIAANNAAEAQRAQFDFGVDKARTDALNTANMMDRRYQLMIQQLNDQAESQQYAALSQNLSNALESLTNIGRQNAILNQANSNRALYDRVWPNMWATYKG